MFLREVFKKGSIDSLDQETLFTIQRFFENNLNVSETSRKLFVHRNTLVYRLEKIKRLTGLDLREFDDAIVFKVALMVKKVSDGEPCEVLKRTDGSRPDVAGCRFMVFSQSAAPIRSRALKRGGRPILHRRSCGREWPRFFLEQRNRDWQTMAAVFSYILTA